MAHEKEISAMTSAIVNAHGGKAYFNITEASKIIGCSRNTLPAILHSAGIGIKRIGTSNRVSAYELAGLMCRDRTAPINTR